MPKLLVLDIETVPATAYVWKLFKENISLDQLIEPGRMISWAAKWVGKTGTIYHDEREGRKEMLVPLYDLLVEADAVITYNGNRFDLPKIAGAMIDEGLPPLPKLTSIDLYLVVKKLGQQSNKLQYALKHWKLGEKISTGGFPLWPKVMAGDEKAWTKMRRYNINDTIKTSKLYRFLAPHIHNHPYLGSAIKPTSCVLCGSHRLQSRGTYRTAFYSTPRLQCQKCGKWNKGKRTKVVI